MAQEWTSTLCRKLCIGMEKAPKEQRTEKSISCSLMERCTMSGVCRWNCPKQKKNILAIQLTCKFPEADMRRHATCPACSGHMSKDDVGHSHRENECRYAAKHIADRKARASASNRGQLPTLPPIVEADHADHGAPKALDKEPVLYPDESEDMVATENLGQIPPYADPEGLSPPPPLHPRHANVVGKRKSWLKQVHNQIRQSTGDIDRAITAFRSGRPEIQRQLLRRLHVRWWHASTTKMQHILRQAGISGPVIDMCKSICETCRICREWAPPGHRPMAKTRISTAFNQVMHADLLFLERSNHSVYDR